MQSTRSGGDRNDKHFLLQELQIIYSEIKLPRSMQNRAQ